MSKGKAKAPNLRVRFERVVRRAGEAKARKTRVQVRGKCRSAIVGISSVVETNVEAIVETIVGTNAEAIVGTNATIETKSVKRNATIETEAIVKTNAKIETKSAKRKEATEREAIVETGATAKRNVAGIQNSPNRRLVKAAKLRQKIPRGRLARSRLTQVSPHATVNAACGHAEMIPVRNKMILVRNKMIPMQNERPK